MSRDRPDAHRSVVSVPGKLILMGEHAVVYGHPAIVAAVDLRLRVTIESNPGQEVLLHLPQIHRTAETTWEEISNHTRGARSAWRRLVAGDDRKRQAALAGPGNLVRLALGLAVRHIGAPPEHGITLTLESEIPIGSGFGSSAAIAVAVPATLLGFTHQPADDETLLRLSLDIERLQHGLPSGIDNTAVLVGGLLWAQHEHRSGDLAWERIGTHVGWLDTLSVYHSGTPAETTGEVVTTVRQRLAEYPARYEKLLQEIERCTRALRTTLDNGRPITETMELVQRSERALEELGVVPEPTRAVIRKIEAEGGAAKISGAGALSGTGAGSVIVVHPDPEVVDRWVFLEGWRRLPVRLPADGLRREELS